MTSQVHAGQVVGRALLPTKEATDEPVANLALEEAIFLRNEGFVARVWENKEAVIIGRAQLAAHETDLGVLLHERNLQLKTIRYGHVVRVHHRDVAP